MSLFEKARICSPPISFLFMARGILSHVAVVRGSLWASSVVRWRRRGQSVVESAAVRDRPDHCFLIFFCLRANIYAPFCCCSVWSSGIVDDRRSGFAIWGLFTAAVSRGLKGATSWHSRKLNGSESGCRECEYYLKKVKTPRKMHKNNDLLKIRILVNNQNVS